MYLMCERVCRHLEDALSKNDSVSARTQEKFGSQIDKVQEEMESVRACAVSSSRFPCGPAAELVRVCSMFTARHSATHAPFSASATLYTYPSPCGTANQNPFVTCTLLMKGHFMHTVSQPTSREQWLPHQTEPSKF